MMEKNKNKGRGRPKKDFGELKEKINQEAIENKGKFKRGRPKKLKEEISTNTIEEIKIENDNNFTPDTVKQETSDSNMRISKAEQISKKFLYCCTIFFLISLVIFSIQKLKESNTNKLKFSETSDNIAQDIEKINDEDNITLEIGYNDNSGNFVGLETLETNDIEETITTENNDENITLIKTFYEQINKKDFDSIKSITDKYLKDNNSYKTYFSANRLTNFLNKILNNEIYITNIKEIPYEKSNVQRYVYDLKYVLNSDQKLHQEQRQIDVVDRNGEHLIGSIMCITTGCSKMPFFQK